MTPTEYRAQLDRLGLTQTGAARLCGVGDRTSRGYALGERTIPEPVIRLLRVCEAIPEALDMLR